MGLKSTLRTVAGIAAGGAALGAAYLAVIRPWFLRWGATEDEVLLSLPGDELVADAPYESTRAITIAAPVDAVWPWLAQFGQGRGGLYSYDWLENLLGCDIHSVDRVIPEYQDLKVGDTVRLVCENYPVPLVFEVARVEPGQHLVLRTPGDPTANIEAGFPDASWAFVLQPVDPDTTRLIVRWRADYKQGDLAVALWNHYGIEPVHFIMEQKTMRGIKERAEKLAAGQIPAGA